MTLLLLLLLLLSSSALLLLSSSSSLLVVACVCVCVYGGGGGGGAGLRGHRYFVFLWELQHPLRLHVHLPQCCPFIAQATAPCVVPSRPMAVGCQWPLPIPVQRDVPVCRSVPRSDAVFWDSLLLMRAACRHTRASAAGPARPGACKSRPPPHPEAQSNIMERISGAFWEAGVPRR